MTTLSTNLPLDTFNIELDWPTLPDTLCNELIEYAKSMPNIWEGKNSDFKEFEQYACPEILKQWVSEFLPFIPSDYTIRLQAVPKSTILRPHKDALRASSYNFVLTDDGGKTNWHDDAGNIIHSTNYKPKIWYQHQSLVTHSVDSILSSRFAITIFKFELQPWFIKENPSVLNSAE